MQFNKMKLAEWQKKPHKSLSEIIVSFPDDDADGWLTPEDA